jgi:hypothetical protein
MRLVQLSLEDGTRRVAVSDGGTLRLVRGATTTRELGRRAIAEGRGLARLVEELGYDGTADWDRALAAGRILPPADHPEPARCHVTGTGLTHLGSAEARSQMHANLAAGDLTDSMKMFKMGLEGGKSADGGVGVQPEWFYKGNGTSVVPPGGALSRPSFAQDGGDEPEICGVYLIGDDGTPWRLGFALGNEFSDHAMERVNYLYLAHSKLRSCSFGPELLVGDLPGNVRGRVAVVRNGEAVWERDFLSGEENMTHTIANLEAHHFKYPSFRRPGDVHVHFFGTGTFSFKDGIEVRDGDVLRIESGVFGRPLENPVKFDPAGFVAVKAL